jgi:hypothetical protein
MFHGGKLKYCIVDFDSLDDNEFGISIGKYSDDSVSAQKQLVGNKQQLVTAQ